MQKLAEICVRRPVFATMLILALTVVGGFSYFSLGVDLFPKIDLPTVVVTVVNPGASPQEIETEISDKVEASINTISGVDELRSTSVEGVATVIVTFTLEKNGDVAAQEVRDKVSLVVPDLPETAEAPVIQKIDPDATPVLRIAVSAPRSLRDVTEIADNQIKEKIESINGVGQVQIVGGSQRQMQIRVDPMKMRAYGVTVTDVTNAVRQQNLEVPGGRVDEGTRELTVRTLGRLTEAEQFNEIAITKRGDYVVKLRDIGIAREAGEELRTAARLDGQPAVTVIVSKQSGQNTVSVADAIKQELIALQKTLPQDVKLEVIGDQSIFIKASVDSIKTHLIEGGLLAALVVFLFLWNFRSTLIAAIAIPTSIIATFGMMAAIGYTLNTITMLALTLMVGIVIDDAIVVLENIYRFIEEKGMSPYQAAIEGTKEIGLAVMATTLSLLAVFLPVGFMGGIVGRFMSSFGLTAAFAIAVSLLVSFTLTPMLAARFIKREEAKNEGENERRGDGANAHHSADPQSAIHNPNSKESRFYRPVDRTYTWLLHWSMAHRWMVVIACALVIISIVPLFMFVGKNFLPQDDQSQFEISVRAAEGSTLTATSTIVERIAREVRQMPGVIHTLTTVGGGQQAQVNTGSVYVKLSDLGDREESQEELMVRTRELLKQFPPELRLSVQPVAAIGGGGARNAAVQFAVTGPDLDKLTRYSNELLQKMKTIPDVVDPDTSLVIGKPELRVAIDRKRAADLNVRVGDIAQALNTLIAGQKLSTYNRGDDQYDVEVRALETARISPESLKNMSVSSTTGVPVNLDQVVKIAEGSGPSSIDRINRQRQVTLSANIRPGGSQAAAVAQMENFVKEIKLDSSYAMGAAGNSKELARAGYYFMVAISLSFVFMYMVLAAQFESFIHPITILLTLPLAIPFGILSLLVTGQTVNIFSGLGLLLLFGVVKKNAILQIDHTNTLRSHGMSRFDAIIQANRDRLRPILMTTIALVAGMLPLVISSGPGAGTNRSIGVLVVGGQSLCLLLTLLAVPVFYSLFDDLGESPMWQRIGQGYDNFKLGARRRFTRAVSSAKMFIWLAMIFGMTLLTREVTAQDKPVTEPTQSPQSLPPPPIAPNFKAPPRPLPSAQRVGVDAADLAPLTLQEAIEMALQNSNDIDTVRQDVIMSGFDLKAARGVFDPVLSSENYFERSVTPTGSSLGGGANGAVTQTNAVGTARLKGFTPLAGGNYQLDFTSSRQTTNNQFTSLNPQFPSALTLNYVQPLIRGLRIDDNRRRIEIAKKNLTLTDAQFRQKTTEVITNVVRAYWDLTFSLRNLQVQLDAVKQARAQVESNQRQVDQGVLAPVDIVAANAQVATFEQNVYTAQEGVTRAENTLKTLLLAERTAPLWSRGLLPTTPVNVDPPRVALPEAINTALANRPEITQLQASAEVNQINSRFFRDQTKPQLDLVGTYTSNGLAGTLLDNGPNPLTAGLSGLFERLNLLSANAGLPPLPPLNTGTGVFPVGLVGGSGRSLGNLFAQNYPTLRVGVRVGLPLGNRIASANLGRSLAEGTRIQDQRAQTEQLIEADVRNTMQAVRSAEARLAAAAASRDSFEQLYNSEQRKLQAGTSTVFLLLQRQTDLIAARGRELQAQTDLNKAIADFQRATGDTFQTHHISVKLERTNEGAKMKGTR